MRRLLALSVFVLALSASPADAASTRDVGIAGFAFKNGVCPAPAGNNITTVNVGDTVRWTNCDPTGHNITWKKAGGPANQAVGEGQSAQQIFSRAGSYEYYCSIHATSTSDRPRRALRR